ncbi:hypothetical protein V8F33_006213 [Rhypophila sp. PSN 637]
MPSNPEVLKTTVDLDRVQVPEDVLALKIVDLVSTLPRAVIYQENIQRLKMAIRLDLDFDTLSISTRTGLILFHGATDEQMESESQNDGDIIGLKDIRMWLRFCAAVEDQSECERMGSFEMDDLKEIAHKIVHPADPYNPVARSSVKKIVEDCHRRFLGVSYPIDAVISVLERLRDREYISQNMGHLKGSEGHVTLKILWRALHTLVPENERDGEWKDEIMYRFILPLHRLLHPGILKDRLYDDLKRFRDDYGAAHPPSVIYPFLKTLPREEQIQHWVTVLDAVYDRFGYYYAVVNNEYLRPLDHFPGILPEVDARVARNKDPSTRKLSEPLDFEADDADKVNGWATLSEMKDWEDWVAGRASKKRKIGDA